MMKKIRLQNFKCFKNEAIEFAPFNILAGLNGMGKSSFIQALLLLRQNYMLKSLQKGISLNGELVQIGNSKDLLYQYFTRREISIEIITNKNIKSVWKWDAQVSDTDYLPLKKDAVINENIFDISLFKDNFKYLNAERIGPRVYFETSNYKVINQNQLGIRGEFAVNYLAVFQDENIPITQLKHPDTEGLTLREQINAWLGEIRPGTRINVISNLDMSLVGLNYQFIGGTDAGNNFRPTNVGFGLSYLLPILVAVLSSPPGSLIIVENPEAHLHPKGQVQIAKLFALAAANGVQVILETHSDHILNGARIAVKKGLIKKEQTNILFFTGKVIKDIFQHYIQKLKIDDNGRIDYWPDDFFDEWDKALEALLMPEVS